MATPHVEQVIQSLEGLTSVERLAVLEALASMVRADHEPPSAVAPDDDEPPLTREELAALLQVEPLSGAEIVARGLTGTWAHLGISDGAEWVNEQKRKRRERRQW